MKPAPEHPVTVAALTFASVLTIGAGYFCARNCWWLLTQSMIDPRPSSSFWLMVLLFAAAPLAVTGLIVTKRGFTTGFALGLLVVQTATFAVLLAIARTAYR